MRRVQDPTKSNETSRTAACALAALLYTAGALGAQTGMSSAFGESVALQLQPAVGSPSLVGSGPLPLVAGTAPAPFQLSGSLSSTDLSLRQTGRPILSTRQLAVHASSGEPATDTANADATVTTLSLDLDQNRPLFTLDADVVRSTAGLTGSCGAGLSATGTTTIVNPRIGGLLTVGRGIAVSPPPNTVLVDLPTLRVVLNEQIPSGAAGVQSLTVNALHASFNALPIPKAGLLSGDIVIAQSHAEIHCATGSADLGVSIDGSPNPAPLGGTITYSISIANAGPDDTEQTTLTDLLPVGVSLLDVSTTQGTCSGDWVVLCDLGPLPAGSQAFITIAVQANALGTRVNTATGTSALSDPNPLDNEATTYNIVQNGGSTGELTAPPRTHPAVARPPA
jgi:uncharacterized repeat protein (TIGR01451 family)